MQAAAMQLATAGPGSAFLAFGQAVTPVVARRAKLNLELVQTSGSADNARRVSAGRAPFGLVNLATAAEAWHGRGPFTAGRLRGMAAVAPMYEAPLAVIALRRAGIATLRDLEGKRVAVGPAEEPSAMFFAGLQAALGLRATALTGPPADLAAGLLRGEADAFWYGVGLPAPPFEDVLRQEDAVVFGLQPEEAAALRSRFATLAPYEVSALTYRGQEAPFASVAAWSFVVAHAGAPDEAVSRLTAALIEGADEAAQAYPAAAAMRAINLDANTVLPWHPGAAAYYRGASLTLPQAAPG